MKILIFLYTLLPLLASAERCGDVAYFSPTGRCEPCGKLCDRPLQYPDSCQRLCPNYVAKDRSTTTPIPSKSSLQNFVTPENCGNEAYFGPTGRCESCGKLCDRPAEFPDSCKRLCPDYVAKDSPISTTRATSPQQSSTPWIIEGFVGFGALIIVLLLGILMWKKLLKPYLAQLDEQRARKKLRLPTQVQNDRTGNDETAPLNEEAFSIDIGDFGNEVLNSITDIYNAHLTDRNDRSDSSDTGVTNTDDDTDNSNDGNFDFGETFPFHSLTSLKSVF